MKIFWHYNKYFINGKEENTEQENIDANSINAEACPAGFCIPPFDIKSIPSWMLFGNNPAFFQFAQEDGVYIGATLGIETGIKV